MSTSKIFNLKIVTKESDKLGDLHTFLPSDLNIHCLFGLPRKYFLYIEKTLTPSRGGVCMYLDPTYIYVYTKPFNYPKKKT